MCANAVKHLTATSDWFYIPWHQGHPLHLPPQATDFYRHKRSKNGHRNLTATSDQALNAAPVTQKHNSLTAVKKDHLRQSKNEPKAIGASHRHKRGTSHNSWESLTIFTINHYHLPNMLVKVKGCPSVEATVGKSDILLIRKTNDLN